MTVQHTQKDSSILFNIMRKRFWEYDVTKFDVEKDKEGIIETLFSRGLFDEILFIIDFYGQEKVLEVLKKSNSLGNDSVKLAAILFGEKKENFASFYCNRFR